MFWGTKNNPPFTTTLKVNKGGEPIGIDVDPMTPPTRRSQPPPHLTHGEVHLSGPLTGAESQTLRNPPSLGLGTD